VKDHPEIPWNLQSLAGNKNIPFEYIEEKMYEGFPWYASVNLTMKDILKYHDASTNWSEISFYVSMKDIEEHPELPWDWHCVSMNQNLNIEMVLKHHNKMGWENISSNKGITMDIIEKYPELSWCWAAVSFNPNLTFEMLLKNLDKDWDWTAVTEQACITMEIISTHPDLPWDMESLVFNRNITSDYVLDNLDKNWVMEFLSMNPFHNYRREKKLIRDRIGKVLNLNQLICEMKNETYFKKLPKDIVNLISIYY
jgi:hypothetical protein